MRGMHMSYHGSVAEREASLRLYIFRWAGVREEMQWLSPTLALSIEVKLVFLYLCMCEMT